MRPSDLKEKNDRVVALTLTIIIHAVIIAALFFIATPKFEAKKVEPIDVYKRQVLLSMNIFYIIRVLWKSSMN